MRTIENKIRDELSKYDDIEYEESESSSDKENSYINHLYEIFPIEDEEKELNRKISLADVNEKKKKELIYDNLYLYKNDEDDVRNTEIKKEVYDILNPKKPEENLESDNKSKEIDEPPKSPRFFIKRRKFRKTRKQTVYRKLTQNEDSKQEKKEIKITLDHKINNFFEQIQKLKGENIEEVDYDKILREIMANQGDNYIEENIIKEIRLLNFFRYFQTKRKIELDRKNNFKNKYSFNSPINFRKNKVE